MVGIVAKGESIFLMEDPTFCRISELIVVHIILRR